MCTCIVCGLPFWKMVQNLWNSSGRRLALQFSLKVYRQNYDQSIISFKLFFRSSEETLEQYQEEVPEHAKVPHNRRAQEPWKTPKSDSNAKVCWTSILSYTAPSFKLGFYSGRELIQSWWSGCKECLWSRMQTTSFNGCCSSPTRTASHPKTNLTQEQSIEITERMVGLPKYVRTSTRRFY